MDKLEKIKEEEINLEYQKARLKHANTKELEQAAELWIEIVSDRLKVLKEEKVEGYIIEISHVVSRKFHIYMPDDRPYEITVIQDKMERKSEVKVMRKMPDELIHCTDPDYIAITDMVKKELEK